MGDEPLTRDTHARGTRPRRPALEVHLPAAPRSLWPRLDALLDDYAPFAIEDIETDASPPRTRRVYFFSPTARDNASRAIARELGPEGVRAAPTEVPDDGWAERAQRRLRAVQIDDVIVAPPWDRPSPGQTAAHIVEIEPSMGFGTGHHASTRLAVRALLQHRTEVGRSRHLLDIGTGSGILAITAATLGASSITAIDRDADALTNARRNIARNGVGRSVRLVLADGGGLDRPDPSRSVRRLRRRRRARQLDRCGVRATPSGNRATRETLGPAHRERDHASRSIDRADLAAAGAR